jgi:hypothetical protein
MKLYQVDIHALPSDAAEFARALRVVGKMSLADASSVEALLRRTGGGTVVAGVELPVAEHVARELGKAGARIVIAESSVRSPASCNPAAAGMFVWSKFRSLEAA